MLLSRTLRTFRDRNHRQPSTSASFSRETLLARKSRRARDVGERGGAKERQGAGRGEKKAEAEISRERPLSRPLFRPDAPR